MFIAAVMPLLLKKWSFVPTTNIPMEIATVPFVVRPQFQ
jgi:hypothetical protein